MSRVPGCTKFSYLTTTLANRASIAQAGSCKAPTAPGSLQSTKDAQPFESEQEAPTGFASRSSSSSQHCLLSSPSPSSSSRVWLRTAASLGRPPSRLPTHKRLLASSKPGAELGGRGGETGVGRRASWPAVSVSNPLPWQQPGSKYGSPALPAAPPQLALRVLYHISILGFPPWDRGKKNKECAGHTQPWKLSVPASGSMSQQWSVAADFEEKRM